jgi:cell division protein ZapB
MLPLFVNLDNSLFTPNRHLYVSVMTSSFTDQPLALQELEEKLDRLIEQYQAVKKDNDLLRLRQQELQEEKAQLLEKSVEARGRVEAMINRLKVLEQSHLENNHE